MTAARIFDLNSCPDLPRNLERELVGLEYSLDGFGRADHVANFAVWAWRLTEWVHAEIAARGPLRRRLAAACGASVDEFDLDHFQAYVAGRQGSPALACCRA